ncbi:uncharacterized protein LAJ45_10943 [Morchella importuna]|uniref:uncharacterized protein n=1 Tax=Morchella importuna TaxID=1174673 RepID=UPI001E8D9291|nr:uncharacterized protein LAJ45_10943 [Morchella importuna]KAH8145032.1 hypothetical protein LAJ45_10943 [Morchella importuna]
MKPCWRVPEVCKACTLGQPTRPGIKEPESASLGNCKCNYYDDRVPSDLKLGSAHGSKTCTVIVPYRIAEAGFDFTTLRRLE